MYLEVDRLVSELLEHPVGHSLTITQEVALQDILMDSQAVLYLFRILAEQSPGHAEAIFIQFGSQVIPTHLPGLEKLIAQYKEIQEARELNSLTDEELEARLTMLALLPSDSAEAQRMSRLLVRVLSQRNRNRAFEICAVSAEEKTDFWRGLRRELFWAFRDSNPELALSVLEEAFAGYQWLFSLLRQPGARPELRTTVLRRTLELENRTAWLTTLKNLVEQVSAIKSPTSMAFLAELTYLVENLEAPERGAFLETLVRAARALPGKEKRRLLKAIQRNIVPQLPKAERARALGQLLREACF